MLALGLGFPKPVKPPSLVIYSQTASMSVEESAYRVELSGPRNYPN
jgi:hypothetical protein